MSYTRMIEDDPATLTKTYMHYDSESDMVTTYDEQNVDDIHDIVKEARKTQPSWRKWKGDFHQIGMIPNTVYWYLWKKGMLPSQDKEAFRKWWNENQSLWNTKTGRL